MLVYMLLYEYRYSMSFYIHVIEISIGHCCDFERYETVT